MKKLIPLMLTAAFASGAALAGEEFDFTKYDAYVPSDPNHLRAAAEGTEEHEIVDFMVGRNVGLGALGGRATLSVGLRRAELQSASSIQINGIPNRVQRADFSSFPPFDRYTATLASDRSFEGAGPVIEWDGAFPILGGDEQGWVNVDWTVGGGVLFGSQKLANEETQYHAHYPHGFIGYNPTVIRDDVIPPRSRSEDVTVPNLSLSLGLSYSIDRLKVSTGYSYDRFFDAIDGGWEDAKSHDRTIDGPYFKLSVGFGG